MVVVEGGAGSSMYLVISGLARAEKNGHLSLTEYRPGSIFGEQAAMEADELLRQVIPPIGAEGLDRRGPGGVLPAVSWPWVPACGSLEPPRQDGENAQKTGKNGEKMGEIRPKTCEGRELTKDQLAATEGASASLSARPVRPKTAAAEYAAERTRRDEYSREHPGKGNHHHHDQ